MPINSRNKGAACEREFAALLFDQLGIVCRRNLEQSRSGGHDLEGLPGWAPEVKARSNPPLPAELNAMWQQTATQATKAAARPVLAVKINRRGWRCHIDLADLRPDLFNVGDARAEIGVEAFVQIVRGLLCD